MAAKKVVKLTRTQLRGIIKEAIQGRNPGDPLFTPPSDKKQLREGAEGNFALVEAVYDAFRTALDVEWKFDPHDPSMSSQGERAWEDQKDHAASDFMNQVSDIIDGCIDKLVQGEYHIGEHHVK